MVERYQEGKRAHAEGKARHENPYDINSEDWSRWMDGFDQAATEADYGTHAVANGQASAGHQAAR